MKINIKEALLVTGELIQQPLFKCYTVCCTVIYFFFLSVDKCVLCLCVFNIAHLQDSRFSFYLSFSTEGYFQELGVATLCVSDEEKKIAFTICGPGP